jgi:hypothetical protein
MEPEGSLQPISLAPLTVICGIYQSVSDIHVHIHCHFIIILTAAKWCFKDTSLSMQRLILIQRMN